jgi:hypothetical protein
MSRIVTRKKLSATLFSSVALDCKVAVYVPANRSCDTAHIIATRMSKLYGGATTIEATGYWQGEIDKLVIVYSYCNRAKINKPEIINMCEYVKIAENQRSVAYAIDSLSSMYFV